MVTSRANATGLRLLSAGQQSGGDDLFANHAASLGVGFFQADFHYAATTEMVPPFATLTR
jgi:hypothetical protein